MGLYVHYVYSGIAKILCDQIMRAIYSDCKLSINLKVF